MATSRGQGCMCKALGAHEGRHGRDCDKRCTPGVLPGAGEVTARPVSGALCSPLSTSCTPGAPSVRAAWPTLCMWSAVRPCAWAPFIAERAAPFWWVPLGAPPLPRMFWDRISGLCAAGWDSPLPSLTCGKHPASIVLSECCEQLHILP